MAWTPEMRQKAYETRRKRAVERAQKSRTPLVSGIGDSKVFIAPHPEKEKEREALLQCHVGGKLVSELPDHVIALISYQHTDEGFAERNQGKSDTHLEYGRSGGLRLRDADGTTHKEGHVADDYGQSLARMEDAAMAGDEDFLAESLRTQLEREHTRSGFTLKWLSVKKNEDKGTRGYKIVEDKDGNPVQVRTQVLGEIPVRKRDQREKFYRDQATRALRIAQGQMQITRDPMGEPGPEPER